MHHSVNYCVNCIFLNETIVYQIFRPFSNFQIKYHRFDFARHRIMVHPVSNVRIPLVTFPRVNALGVALERGRGAEREQRGGRTGVKEKSRSIGSD